YMPLIGALGDRVILHDRFVADSDVKYYFSAAEAVILPYKSATQSGVTQIAYNFCLPIIVSDVGGLAEIVPDDVVGCVCPPTVEGVAAAVDRMNEDGNIERFRRNMAEERKRFSWEEMCSRITEVYKKTTGH
ncbi:MAG TPA: glycosyltransferase, partial [Candidatus Alistipes excrementipullorum]|nr:glycosyltransferase [Candidatus Alistipes excrementipullorum]